jgi:membrane fusion protein (multidrug efflux system)
VWQQPESEQSTATSGPPGPSQRKLTVTGVIVEPKQFVNKISVTGEIVPNEFLELKSEISGKIDRIYFKEGQAVKKGQLLVKINVDDLIAEREKLLYTKKLRETLEHRYRQLLDREAISQEEYDQSLTELQTADADINVLNTEIQKSEIRAPFSGIVGLRQVSQGAYVTSATVLAPLYSIHPAKVQFAIPSKYSTQVKVGNRISFTTEGIPTIFEGELYAIEPRVDPNTRTLTLRARCPNRDGKLLPGQFIRVELILEIKENVMMVPTEAVIPELGTNKVYIQRGGVVVPAIVETGTRTDTDLEITSGIEAGDTVLTSGILQLRPGMGINVIF